MSFIILILAGFFADEDGDKKTRKEKDEERSRKRVLASSLLQDLRGKCRPWPTGFLFSFLSYYTFDLLNSVWDFFTQSQLMYFSTTETSKPVELYIFTKSCSWLRAACYPCSIFVCVLCMCLCLCIPNAFFFSVDEYSEGPQEIRVWYISVIVGNVSPFSFPINSFKLTLRATCVDVF